MEEAKMKKQMLLLAIVLCILGGVTFIIIKHRGSICKTLENGDFQSSESKYSESQSNETMYDEIVKSFDLIDYQDYIDNFSSDKNIDIGNDIKIMLEKVENIWVQEYGDDVKKQKPYEVFYDETSKVWLVRGTLPSDTVGGVANILVDNDTGKVLAIWHDK